MEIKEKDTDLDVTISYVPKEGKGIDYYNNGDRYEGDFKNDKRE